jgi:hypothetical protein
MIKFAGVVAMVLLGLTPFSFARKEETLKELVARAEASKPDQQPDLYMEAADRQRKAAVDAVKASRWEEFGTELQDVVTYCNKAHAAAISSNKQIKIRRISSHLKDIKLDVEVDDQPEVQAAIDQLEQFRTDLMRKMFGGKSND